VKQARGIIPREGDRVIKNPEASGYFVGVRLRRDIRREGLVAWLEGATAGVRDLLEPHPERGDEADVAVGLAPSLFGVGDAIPIDPPLQRPAGFVPEDVPIPHLEGTPLDADVLFYVMSLSEARVARLLEALWGSAGRAAERILLERGYQRLDGTEAFGYADGLRNVRSRDRFRVVFVHRDGEQLEEPPGAEGGSYLVYMKIAQNPDAFAELSPEAQDAVMGRHRDGTRLDRPGVRARAEASMPESEPPAVTSHIRKAGPRGARDDVQIFRRGLPFVEGGPDGSLRVGLHFVSFQATLDHFDVVFNDWILNPTFPQVAFPIAGTGRDALFDGQLTTFERSGLFFCPPEDEDRHIGASLFDPVPRAHPATKGRVAIRKRVVSDADPGQRFERGGFQFQIFDQVNQPVGGVMTTDSKGHARSDEIPTGSYVLRETHSPRSDLAPVGDIPFTLDRNRLTIRVVNHVQGAGPYGAR
jgi:Dyp-type peroxidase family